MTTELFKEDHGEQAWAGMAARDCVERRRRFAETLAVAATEFLAHDLLYKPLARNDFERLGDDFAGFGEFGAAATWARGWRCKDDALARQLLREWLPHRPR